MKSSFAFLRLFVLPALVCVTVAWLLSLAGWMAGVENITLDLRTRFRARFQAPPDQRLLVAGIDDYGQQADVFGRWPWPRKLHGQMIALAANEGAAVVAWDIMFIEEDTADLMNDATLGRYAGAAMNNGTDVVFAAVTSERLTNPVPDGQTVKTVPLTNVEGDIRLLDGDNSMEAPMAALQTLAYFGFVDSPIDPRDGMRRAVPLVVRVGDKVYAGLSLQTLIRYWKVNEAKVRVRLGDAVYVPTFDGECRIPIDQHGRYFVNYRFGEQTANIGSYAKMLWRLTDARVGEAKDADIVNLKGKIVLVGQNSTGLTDNGPTPFGGSTPLVLVHANIIDNILNSDFARRASTLSVGLAAVLVGLVSAWGLRNQKLAVRAACALGVPALYLLAATWAWISHSIWLPVVWPILGFGALQVHGIAVKLIAEQRAKEQIKGMFGTYVSPMVVNRMVESGETPRLGGHVENITAYFSDIEGFSTFSEVLPADRLVELLNEYLTACTDILQEEGGTLDKYIGDAVVVMFGAPIKLPDHQYRACVAAMRVQKKIGELRAKWRAEGDKWPELVWRMRSRIGLNSGNCVIGNMGSRVRFNYTMMGDDVNLAARMESGAKKWGVYSMCTEATKAACEQHGGDRVVFRSLGKIMVMGRSQGVPCYEVVGLKEDVTAETHQCVALFEAGLARYLSRDWAGALDLLAQSEALERHGPGREAGGATNPSRVFIDLVHEAQVTPPAADWDGVQVMKEK